MQWCGIRYDTKIILWRLFILQLLLIGVFWVLQSVQRNNEKYENNYQFSVHFIKSAAATGKGHLQENDKNKIIEVNPVSHFSSDFILFTESGSNYDENITCYREGIIEEKAKNIKRCRCQPEWHGKDCGQPEVLWRAFLTSRVPLIVSQARLVPHKVFYMITGYFFSIDLLEIQIMELKNCVDLFIICNKNQNETILNSKSLRKMNLPDNIHERILIINTNPNCTPKLVYQILKNNLVNNTMKSDDIFLISHNDQILNHKSIKYLKYYDNSPGLIKFRLKYNIYGFFWQHPENTRIGCAACSINQLEKNFKSDPNRLILTKKTGIIVGDLNHIGGWLCEYCYQPNEIIKKLQIDTPTAIFPKSTKNQPIDSNYIQNLIARGLYVDGKLGLNRIHRYSDKYYAPEYVERNGRKFDNILSNIFLNFNDDILDEDYRV